MGAVTVSSVIEGELCSGRGTMGSASMPSIRSRMSQGRLAALGLAAMVSVSVGTVVAPAAASAAPSNDPATNVWLHGGSNLGECSVYLAGLDVPGIPNVRAEVNHVIQQDGSLLGISSPGALYSVRAHQEVNLAPAQECLPRQLPGGGQG